MSDKKRSKTIRNISYVNLPNILDSNISKEQSNAIYMNKNNDKEDTKDSKPILTERINISILKSRMDFLREYKLESGMPPGNKCSELLNEAIANFEIEYKAKKDSKR